MKNVNCTPFVNLTASFTATASVGPSNTMLPPPSLL